MTYSHLNPDFFKSHPVTQDFFQKWQLQAAWNPSVFPIYQWDHCLFIGAASPSHVQALSSQFSPKGTRLVFVLVPSEHLQACWNSFHETPASIPTGNLREDDFFAQLEKTAVAKIPEPKEELLLQDAPPEEPTPLTSPEELLDLPEVLGNQKQEAPPAAPASVSTFKEAFQQLSYQFSKSIILVTDGKNAKVLDASSPPRGMTSASYSFEQPSFFRIVAQTKKPYHGYVLANEATEKFFEDWNSGKLPDHLTVSPLMVDESLLGFLVSFGEKSSDNSKALQLSQDIAQSLSVNFKENVKAA
ncbi:MAG: hypothetical protein LW875_05060 [Proteobacteria bacterium]|jgi:hypothetical protein|nr:hypothetical protein [Pseudomonadota bacterium]